MSEPRDILYRRPHRSACYVVLVASVMTVLFARSVVSQTEPEQPQPSIEDARAVDHLEGDASDGPSPTAAEDRTDGTSGTDSLDRADAVEPAAQDDVGATFLSVPPPNGSIRLSGAQIIINDCLAFDAHEGLDGGGFVSLSWSRPRSRAVWLQQRFRRALAEFGDDRWQAWTTLGGGLLTASVGMTVEGLVTGEFVTCGRDLIPVVEVDEVLGAYDLAEQRRLPLDAIPFGLSFDTSDAVVSQILAIQDTALSEQTLTVRGITDQSLGWPAWQIRGFESDADEIGPGYGFVELEYEDPALVPQTLSVLKQMMILAEITPGSLRGSRRREMERIARRSAIRGPYTYDGYFTGELRLWEGPEGLFLTPVFVVTGRVEPAP